MKTEMGEFAVGAYLRLCEKCDVVDYNVRPSETGIPGLAEIDVIGLRFSDSTVFLCEVSTHLDGLNYGSYEKTIERITGKLQRQRDFASANLKSFKKHVFMLWSPRVPNGQLTSFLEETKDTEFVINEIYSKRIKALKDIAKSTTKDIGNPFFRSLQILEHLR